MTSETDIATAAEGASTANRAFKIQIAAGDIDKAKLDAVQGQREPWRVMRAYIGWLAANPGWRKTLPFRHGDLTREFRAMAEEKGLQARQPEVLAGLVAAEEVFLQFCVESEALAKDTAAKILADLRAALVENAAEQTEITKAFSPVAKCMGNLRSAINSGRARLRLPEERLNPTPGVIDVGWIDEEGHVLLEPIEFHALMVAMDTERRGVLSIAEMFPMMVVELKATAPAKSEQGRVGVKRTIGGVRQRVIELSTKVFEGVHLPARDAKPAVEDMGTDEIERLLQERSMLWAGVEMLSKTRVRLTADGLSAEVNVSFVDLVARAVIDNSKVAVKKNAFGGLDIVWASEIN
jgi:hypothetical protein